MTYLEKIEVMRGVNDDILNIIIAMYDRVNKETARLKVTSYTSHYIWSRHRRDCLIDLLLDIYRNVWGDENE